jgi:hypothetical protein
LLPRRARLQLSSPGGPAAAGTGPSTSTGIGSPVCALARPQRCRGDDADDDADRDPGRRPAERRGDGGFGARPSAAGEQLEQGRDAARARQQQRIEQVEVGRRLPGREQQHNGDQPPDPGERDELIAERARQVGGGRLREDRVVVVMSKAPVALVAKQPAHLAGQMTMIDAERAAGSLADSAGAILSRQQLGVVLGGEPVAAKALVGAHVSALVTPSMFPGFVSILSFARFTA